jgi:cysteine desulfurase family protein (TIGR01976 family)
MMIPDIAFIRSQFPSLSGEWTFFDNAGGTQTARQVGERVQDYLYQSNVQHGASYEISQQAGNRVMESRSTWAKILNASDPSEIILGSSTTMLLQNLSRSLVDLFEPGDEVIVTNFDHEANIGPWRNMEKQGIHIKVWEIDPETMLPDLKQLKHLMTRNTRLVAFSHVSNILGSINPVKEFAWYIHEHGALVCVDGVAYAPHRLPDMDDLDVDFYVFSMYKVFGPHYSLLYGKRKHLEILPGINHFFIGDEEIPYKLQPGNVNFELSYGLLGITDYFKKVYEHHKTSESNDVRSQVAEVYNMLAHHEQVLATRFLEFLKSKKNVRIIGNPSADKLLRVPTISFVVEGRKSSEIPLLVDPYKIGIRWGDFYARRLITDLDLLDNDGVIRVSMVHYNTLEEVDRLISVLDEIL